MNILFCSTGHQDARRALEASIAGHSLILCAPSDISRYLRDVDVVIPLAARLGAAEFALGHFPLVQQFGAGLDGVDLKAAEEAGVWVANVPAGLYGNADSVAEHAIMMMLALSRRLNFARMDMQERRLSEPAGQAMLRKTCCLVGLGDIGVEIARRLQPFGMHLTAVRRRPQLPIYADLRFDQIYGNEQLNEAVTEADYVVISLPFTPETDKIFGAGALAAMKQGSYLINVGRGGVIDTDALLNELQSGNIAGAGLDVFWEEPADPNHPIFEQNVIATPHVAGVTDSSCNGIAQAIAENVGRLASGKSIMHAANAPRDPRGGQNLS